MGICTQYQLKIKKTMLLQIVETWNIPLLLKIEIIVFYIYLKCSKYLI